MSRTNPILAHPNPSFRAPYEELSHANFTTHGATRDLVLGQLAIRRPFEFDDRAVTNESDQF